MDATTPRACTPNWVRIDPSDRSVGHLNASAAQKAHRQYRHHQGADYAAAAGHGKYVQGIVNVQLPLDYADRKEANCRGSNAQDKRPDRADETGSRSYGCQPGNHSGYHANQGSIEGSDQFQRGPSDGGGGCRDMSQCDSHTRFTIGRERAPPLNPNQRQPIPFPCPPPSFRDYAEALAGLGSSAADPPSPPQPARSLLR